MKEALIRHQICLFLIQEDQSYGKCGFVSILRKLRFDDWENNLAQLVAEADDIGYAIYCRGLEGTDIQNRDPASALLGHLI
jgi:hypothetical protein